MLLSLRVRSLAALLVLVPVAACGPDSPVAPVVPAAEVRPSVPHVVVISIDGLRPDAIGAANATTLQRLVSEGAASFVARTIYPSITLPSHVSMLTGVGPAKHGITWNDDRSAQTGPLNVSTVFDQVGRAGFTSAVIGGKPKLRHLLRAETPMRSSLPAGDSVWNAARVADRSLDAVRANRPQLMFVHLPDADVAGHADGWMSASYLAAVRRADDAVSRIWLGLKEAYGSDFTLIVTADHGGSGRTHGDESAESMQIPWIVWGHGVRPQTLPAGIRTVDTAATVLWILGIPTPTSWDGNAVTGAFVARTTAMPA